MGNIFNKILRDIVLLTSKSKLAQIDRIKHIPFELQNKELANLIKNGSETVFGVEKHFSNIQNYKQFQQNVPIYTYNSFAPYIKRLIGGEHYILWNQKVRWFARSSGTSSDKSKYIPITPDSLRINHFGGMKKMLINYLLHNPKTLLPTTKALTLGGSIVCNSIGINSGSYSGDLSAVMLQNSPLFAEYVRTPKKEVALIANFNKKVELICKESSKQDVSNFSGVPSWNLILLNRILEYTGKNNLLEVWPHLELFMHGGTSFSPYREIYQKLIPTPKMHYVENYNASEGYFAFQDEITNNEEDNGMLLCLDNGIFYEFVPFRNLDEAMEGNNSNVVPLEGVKLGIDYAVIISTVGGLYRYLPEDLIRFTCVDPYRIKVVGRTKLFINAFGEELMTDNVERAMGEACKKSGEEIVEYSVAPEFMQITENAGLKKGRHIWAIEFKNEYLHPNSPNYDIRKVQSFCDILDKELCRVNSDYEAKRDQSTTLLPPNIEPLNGNTFMNWMEKRGKVGGQNKVPRLWKDDTYIKQLLEISNQ